MDQTFSRPIHITNDNLTGGYYLASREATRIAAFSLKPQEGDVIVTFYDGPGGQELWGAEADNASGSHFEDFGRYPLLFPNGIYVKVTDDSGANNWDLYLAVVKPKSSGT